MKAVLLTPLPPPIGGIATWAVSYMETELKNCWKVVAINEAVTKRRGFDNNAQRSVILDIKRCFRIWYDLRNTLKDNTIDVVHSNIPANVLSMMREIVCAIITKMYHRKFVVHFHCTVPTTITGKLGSILFKVLCKLSNGAIVLNNKSKLYVEEHAKTPVFLAPNFVEERRMLRGKKEIRPHIKTALYVGGIIEEKGCSIIIDVAPNFPEINFRLVGAISEKFKNISIPENVILTGVKTGRDLEEEFLNADVFMFLSHMNTEGFSVALTEAMAAGLPCIVTDWAANKDMIEEYGGVVIPTHDNEAVADAIRTLDSDVKLRISCSEWNVKKVKMKYSRKSITDLYVEIYESLLK